MYITYAHVNEHALQQLLQASGTASGTSILTSWNVSSRKHQSSSHNSCLYVMYGSAVERAMHTAAAVPAQG